MDDSMAEAVEKASAVLVCFSHRYQESKSCKKGKLEYNSNTEAGL